MYVMAELPIYCETCKSDYSFEFNEVEGETMEEAVKNIEGITFSNDDHGQPVSQFDGERGDALICVECDKPVSMSPEGGVF